MTLYSCSLVDMSYGIYIYSAHKSNKKHEYSLIMHISFGENIGNCCKTNNKFHNYAFMVPAAQQTNLAPLLFSFFKFCLKHHPKFLHKHGLSQMKYYISYFLTLFHSNNHWRVQVRAQVI